MSLQHIYKKGKTVSEVPTNMHKELKYNYIEKGTGNPVIMLHGMFGKTSNWESIIQAISSSFMAIALELPYLELEPRLCSIEDRT